MGSLIHCKSACGTATYSGVSGTKMLKRFLIFLFKPDIAKITLERQEINKKKHDKIGRRWK